MKRLATCPRSGKKSVVQLYLEGCTSHDTFHYTACLPDCSIFRIEEQSGSFGYPALPSPCLGGGGLPLKAFSWRGESCAGHWSAHWSDKLTGAAPNGPVLHSQESLQTQRQLDCSRKCLKNLLVSFAPSWARWTSWEWARGRPATRASHVSSPSRPPRHSRFLMPRPQPEAQLRIRPKGCLGCHHHRSSLKRPGVALAVRSPPHPSSWTPSATPSAPLPRPGGFGLPVSPFARPASLLHWAGAPRPHAGLGPWCPAGPR